MRSVKHSLVWLVVVVCLIAISLKDLEAAPTGAVGGVIKDTRGIPLAGAVVTLLEGPFSLKIRTRVTTDGAGRFEIQNLVPGLYSLSVTVANYSPLVKSGVRVMAGKIADLNLILENLYQETLGDRSEIGNSAGAKEDIESVLRTASSTRPILRMVESSQENAPAIAVNLEADRNTYRRHEEFRGVVNVYTTAYSTDPEVFDTGGVFTDFALTRDIGARMGWIVAGVFSDTGFAEVDSALRLRDVNGHNASVRLSFGQIPQQDGLRQNSQRLSLLNLDFQDEIRLSSLLQVAYGVELQGTNPAIDGRKIRPRVRIGFQPSRNSRFSFTRTTSLPRMCRTLNLPEGDAIVFSSPFQHEFGNRLTLGTSRVVHTEFSSGQVFRDYSSLAFAVYADDYLRGLTPLLASQGKPELRPSKGIRVTYQRALGSRLDGVLGYTFGGGLRANSDYSEILSQQFHVLTARVNSEIASSGTHMAATYRWISGFSATVIDPYQEIFESSSPGVSLVVTQWIPYFGRFIPGKLEAQLDVRNLFAKSDSEIYSSASLRRIEFLQPTKSVRGGVRLKF